jgi:hypothetical protein
MVGRVSLLRVVSSRARGGAERGLESGPRFGPGGGRFSVLGNGRGGELGRRRRRHRLAKGRARHLRRVRSLEFRAGGMVSLSVGAWLPSAAPDDARAGGHGAGDSCLALSAGGRRGGARRWLRRQGCLQQRGEGLGQVSLIKRVKDMVSLFRSRRNEDTHRGPT